MPLVDEVRTILDRLEDRGWGTLFRRHELEITATDLDAELTRPLDVIDRHVPGFEDFAIEGNQGIAPGNLSRSVLYHALASPYVHPTVDGTPSNDPEDYPTLEELDVVENYVFSLANKRLADFDNPVLAIFAYQYRVGSRSPHRVHADMAYSRTGVSRVGTHDSNYDRRRRSFWVLPNHENGIAVCPARFGVFIAERQSGASCKIAVLDGEGGDRFQQFLLPVHKVFPGPECLRDEEIDPDNFKFLEYHINEKLRKTHLADTPGAIPALVGFRPNESPFVRESAELVRLDRAGASCLLVPHTPDDHRLVHIATQRNEASNQDEVVRFRVPKATIQNRFWTSFQIPGRVNGRAAPEYVNMRQQVTNPMGTVDDLKDLNTLGPDDFKTTLDQPDFDAAHFLDDSCDGAVVVQLTGQQRLIDQLDSVAAYSLVAAPDFLPLTDQVDIQAWAMETLTNLDDHFAQGGPRPLSDGRRNGTSIVDGTPRRGRMPNPALVDARNSEHLAFDRNDPANATVTAVVCPAPLSSTAPAKVRHNVSVSFLPDAASGVFAPGWDISHHGDMLGEFYHAYGLGSPFPEDAKLCAALNSFWPAAAPDVSRTFGIQSSPTALPMLDRELGYHPHHPRVQSGDVQTSLGWDGEYGPFIEQVDNIRVVNFADRDRSDYTRNALDGQMSIGVLAGIDSHEMIERMNALRDCIRILPEPTLDSDNVSDTLLWLVRAERVSHWSASDSPLTGPGFLYEFIIAGGSVPGDPGDLRRSRRAAPRHHVCQIGATQIRWNLNGGAFQPANR